MEHSQGVPMSWQWQVDVFGTVRTTRFLYNVTASSRLGFLRRHRPSTYYVAARILISTLTSRSLLLSLSHSLRYLFSRFFDTFSLARLALSLSLFPFSVSLSISVLLTMEPGHLNYSSSLMFDRFPCCCIFFNASSSSCSIGTVSLFLSLSSPLFFSVSLSLVAGTGQTDARQFS